MNKTILITGGTGKVGTQIVKHFFKKNFNVVFTGTNQNKIDNLIKQTQNSNNKIVGLKINLLEENSAQIIQSKLTKNNLSPNYLINCARSLNFLKVEKNGISNRENWIGELTLDVIIPYELSMVLAKQEDSQLEHIINISSMYGIVPPNPSLYKNPEQDSPIQYGVAKAAQIHLTKELAIRLASKNIKVNAISFGGIEGRVDNEFRNKYAKLCPLKNMLKEEDVIGAIDFLASNNSVGMTGHNLVIDGGWSVW